MLSLILFPITFYLRREIRGRQERGFNGGIETDRKQQRGEEERGKGVTRFPPLLNGGGPSIRPSPLPSSSSIPSSFLHGHRETPEMK